VIADDTTAIPVSEFTAQQNQILKPQNKMNILIAYGTTVHGVLGLVFLTLGSALVVSFSYVKGAT